MKKENFIAGFKIITLGLLLGVGVGIIYATAWSSPSGILPSHNSKQPVNVGIASQVKVSAANTGSLMGGLSVDNIVVGGKANFMEQVIAGNLETYGNEILANNSPALIVDNLKNNSNNEVCVDKDGKLVLCGVVTPPSTFTLTVVKTGSHAANINSHDGGTDGFPIGCGDMYVTNPQFLRCTETFSASKSVTLMGEKNDPNNKMIILFDNPDSWVGCDSIVNGYSTGEKDCQVTMNGNKTVTANFSN